MRLAPWTWGGIAPARAVGRRGVRLPSETSETPTAPAGHSAKASGGPSTWLPWLPRETAEESGCHPTAAGSRKLSPRDTKPIYLPLLPLPLPQLWPRKRARSCGLGVWSRPSLAIPLFQTGLLFSRYRAARLPRGACESCLRTACAAGVMTPRPPSLPSCNAGLSPDPDRLLCWKAHNLTARPLQLPALHVLSPPAGAPSAPCLPG